MNFLNAANYGMGEGEHMIVEKCFLNYKHKGQQILKEGKLYGQYKTRTADCRLRTGYKIWTRYKTRTGKYGLGIKHGLGIKRGLENTDWV